MENIQIFSDGGARGNPGPAAAAFIVFKNKKIIYKHSLFIGRSTNNNAEYTAVLIALQWLNKNTKKNIDSIDFFIDSELVVNQLNGIFKIKNNNLKKIIYSIKVLENNFMGKITYNYISRNKNKEADLLVNQKLDEKILKFHVPVNYLKK